MSRAGDDNTDDTQRLQTALAAEGVHTLVAQFTDIHGVAKGKTTTTPLAAEELEKLTALVRESVGFNQERGDSVKVINAPFRREVQPEVELPLWKQPELIDWARTLAVPGALAAVALLVVFGLVRPALNAARAVATPGQTLDAVVEDQESLPLLAGGGLPVLEAPRSSAQLDQARLLAQQNPAAVAGIVRDWVAGQAA